MPHMSHLTIHWPKSDPISKVCMVYSSRVSQTVVAHCSCCLSYETQPSVEPEKSQARIGKSWYRTSQHEVRSIQRENVGANA